MIKIPEVYREDWNRSKVPASYQVSAVYRESEIEVKYLLHIKYLQCIGQWTWSSQGAASIPECGSTGEPISPANISTHCIFDKSLKKEEELFLEMQVKWKQTK